jgi:hypothetical protein
MSTTNIYGTNDFYRQVYLYEDSPILQELAEFRVHLLNNGYPVLPCQGARAGGRVVTPP